MALSEQPPAPGWVESGSLPNPGLDLTGLRLPILTIGNHLLDGITTVTPSVRYFSFCAWILSSYVHAKGLDTWEHFQGFAEKAETAIALGNRLNDSQTSGIIGARGASRLVNAGSDPLPLQALVKQTATTIYFNPALQLQFLLPRDEVPGLSKERGEPLAEIIRTAFSETSLGARFSSGELISEATLDELRVFGKVASLTNISGEEASLLTTAIIPSEPRTDQEARRVNTYACLLGLAELLSHPPTEDDFFKEAQRPHRSLPDEFHPHMDGWLRHLVRDSIAVGHEYLLKEVIDALRNLSKGRSAISNDAVINHLLDNTNTAHRALSAFGLLAPDENIGILSFGDLFGRIEAFTQEDRLLEEGVFRWAGNLTEVELVNSIQKSPASSIALLPVVWCVAMLRAKEWPESESNPFEGRSGLGWNAMGVHEVIVPGVQRFLDEGWQLRDVMAELALRTVDQHLRVSWSRMAVDTRHDVSLLIADGDRWMSRTEKHVQDFSPGRTASRVGQAVHWMQQLRLVSKAGLTESGTELYRQLCQNMLIEANSR